MISRLYSLAIYFSTLGREERNLVDESLTAVALNSYFRLCFSKFALSMNLVGS